jgi:ABC-type transport system involved in cytochrome bd biosynthesis fused ATPase/permease subunit
LEEIGEIRFKNVSFAYNEKDGDIIHHISFSIAPKVARDGKYAKMWHAQASKYI